MQFQFQSYSNGLICSDGFQTCLAGWPVCRFASLTASILGSLHPRECDGPFPGTLTEPKQECPRLLVLEQSTLSLLADKAHDTPGHSRDGKQSGNILYFIHEFNFHFDLQSQRTADT